MTSDDESELRAFVDAWRTASGRLEALRREELRTVEASDHIDALSSAFEATLAGPVRKSSGLVEQQKIFARMGHAGSLPPCG